MKAKGYKTLAEAWFDYEARILDPVRASSVQRIETRRAFYAGAQTMMVIQMSSFSITGDDEPTEADLKIMSNLDQELRQFAEDLKAGRA